MCNLLSFTAVPNTSPATDCTRHRPRLRALARWLCCGIAAAVCDVRAEDAASLPSLEGASIDELLNVRVTTVSRGESTVGHSPAAVFVITQEMIRRSGATTFPEILRMVPGMNVARIDSNKWAVSARGFNERFGSKLLVQVDGRAVYNPVFAGVYWDSVDYVLDDIDRIEVIRGPGASVWGANAFNGIINIITKTSKDTQGGLLSAGGGSFERGFANVRFGGQIGDNFTFRAYGKWFERDSLITNFDRVLNPSRTPDDDWRGYRGGLRLDWTPTSADTVTLQGDWYHTTGGQQRPRVLALPPFAFVSVGDEVQRGGNVLARWTHEVDKDSDWKLQLYYDRNDRNNTDGFNHLRWETCDLDFQHGFRLGERQKVTWGLGYRYVDFHGHPSGADDGFQIDWVTAYRTTHLFSAFLQDEITLVPERLSLSLGSKVEHNDFTGYEVQPTGRLLWTPTPKQSVWAAVSRAVRTPSLADDELAFTQQPRGPGLFPQLRGNTGFQSEKVIAYELGYRAQATPKLSLDAALFYNVYDDLATLIATGPTPPPAPIFIPVPRTNRLAGETYGAEVAVTWQVTDWWKLYGAYTWLQMNLHRKEHGLTASQLTAFASQDGRIEGESARNQVYLWSSFDLPRNVELDLIGRYVDQLPGSQPGIKSYVALDARLAWKPRENLEIAVVGQNLIGDQHLELGRNITVGGPLNEIERGVYGTVTFTW